MSTSNDGLTKNKKRKAENTMTYNLKWTMGNAKLVKTSGESYRVLGFGIPADYSFEGGNTCPAANACRGVCYAKQGRYLMANVRDARMHNFNLFQSRGKLGFIGDAIADLTRLVKRYNVVRLHDSGDFFSQDYLDAWKAIACAFPNTIFYAYTKSLHLDIGTDKPANLRIVQSLGGKYDAMINLNLSHSRIFSTDDDRIAAGYVDGNVSDIPAIEGEIKIGLVYHGNRKLTDAQSKFFR
jgi:hypothetical protein